MVRERGEQLRRLPFDKLVELVDEPIQHVTVGTRQGTITIIVQRLPTDALRVVIQGFLKARLIPVKHVAMDGFYKYSDGSTTTMPNDEFYEFD
jgi:hypothetical protein